MLDCRFRANCSGFQKNRGRRWEFFEAQDASCTLSISVLGALNGLIAEARQPKGLKLRSFTLQIVKTHRVRTASCQAYPTSIWLTSPKRPQTP